MNRLLFFHLKILYKYCFSQLVWTAASHDSERQGIAIDYPSLTMHGIVTHDPKYPEEHLVVVVQKSNDDDDDGMFVVFGLG